jgi:protein ImuB
MRRRACRPPRLNPAAAAPPCSPADAEDRGREPLLPADRRFLALHLPRLPTDLLRTEEPVALWGQRGPRRLVIAASARAEALGLYPGQPLADARALHPGLRLEPESPGAVPAMLERLALWALRFTPLAAVEEPDSLILDIAGCTGMRGEARLRDEAVSRLARLGFAATGAVAGTPEAALALARAGIPAIVPLGGERQATAPLPLTALPVGEAAATELRRLGLWRVGEVLAQPRIPLARRFGPDLTALLDAVTGRIRRPIRPVRPPPDLGVARDLPEPVVTRAAIDAVFAKLLDALCRKLDEAGLGARHLLLRAHRTDGGVQEIAVGTGLPMRDPAHLARLFRDRLEELAPGFGFDRIALLASRTDPLAPAQQGFAGSQADSARQRLLLAQLLDRLETRLPVWRLEPHASHLPERAMRRVPPLAPVAPEQPSAWRDRPRPVRLLPRPEPVSAVAALPDGAPARLTLHGRHLRIRRAEGPERLLPEWWRDDPARALRDYYRLETEAGDRLWVCRAGLDAPDAPARWFLHGYFA